MATDDPSTTNLTFAGVDGESGVLGLDLRGICVSTGSACATGEPEPRLGGMKG